MMYHMIAMMWGMGLIGLLVIIVSVLAAAAFGQLHDSQIGYAYAVRGVEGMIKELDPVVLTQSLPEQRLQPGDVAGS
jgi:hypothetical protein